ncbi:MAG TPA: hypothetical protein VFC46_08390 [Humisphaera sp.]|nr:hypothetical protein [Humisphaera sp.]
MESSAFSWRSSAGVCLVLLLLLASAIRFWAIPYRYDFRDYDEPHYLTCGLQVFEGMTPVYHYAPAGPEAWFGWVNAGVLSTRYVLFPTPEERQVPAVIRPYTAINHALFDLYRDKGTLRIEFTILNMIVAIFAVAAGYRLGWLWGGFGGAILLGGLLAFMPLLIEYSAMSKSYSMAWSFAMIAIYFAASDRKPRHQTWSAIFLGLAIGSRVEMLGVVPFPLILLWARRVSITQFLRTGLRYAGVMVVTMLLVAPWLLTNLFGNLRAIATVRVATPTGRSDVLIETIRELAWNQGLLVVLLMLFGAIGVIFFRPKGNETSSESAPVDRRAQVWRCLLFGYGLFLLATIFRGTGYGLRHHGPAIMGLLAITPLAIDPFLRRWPRPAWMLIAAAVLLPFVQCVRSVAAFRNTSTRSDVTAWIETHVPPGTDVYVSTTFHDPLPTPEAADVIWNEVASPAAPARKFKSGLERFQLGDMKTPHALSEQHVITERSSERGWYILGSRADFAGPRFNVHPFNESAVFGLYDPVPSFNKTGGILVWRFEAPPVGMKNAVKIWDGGAGTNVSVYATPDVAAHLKAGIEAANFDSSMK